MKNSLLLLSGCVLALSIAGCPTDSGVGDTGTGMDAPRGDTGPTPDTGGRDGGGGGTDGGDRTDGGGGGSDGGGGTPDGGTTDFDGGGFDGGGGTPDGGTTDFDGGGGTPDGGTTGACRINADCARSEYCAKPEAMCAAAGVCMTRPTACSLIFDPVCGCDGMDYSNPCNAASAGVNVRTHAPCGPTTCDLRPRTGCCFDDGDCAGRTHCVNEVCRAGGEGTCVAAVAGGACWEDSDCARGGTCVGADVCPCGVACLLPDSPGRCAVSPTP